MMLLIPNLSAQELTPDRETTVKAAFLFHFTQFVFWPEDAKPADEPYRIALFQAENLAARLENLTNSFQGQKRKIEILRITDIAEAKNAEILFIPGKFRIEQKLAINLLKQHPTLIVSETREFLRLGGMIGLVRSQERVIIVINPEALSRAGLKASSRLLKLARTEVNIE